MEPRLDKGRILVRRLVHEAKSAWDTPALISLLARDQALLQTAFRVLNPSPGADAGLLEAFDKACGLENVTALDLKRRLAPAAAALGFPSKGEEDAAIYYDILDVPSDASNSAIRKAYRAKARELHPDVNPDADPVGFVRISEAYRVLSNPELREQYDATLQRKALWEEKSHAFQEEAQWKAAQRKRQKLKLGLQLAGAVVVLLMIIGLADQVFKEQSLRAVAPERKPAATPEAGKSAHQEDPPLQVASNIGTMPTGRETPTPEIPDIAAKGPQAVQPAEESLVAHREAARPPEEPATKEVLAAPGMPDVEKEPQTLMSPPKEKEVSAGLEKPESENDPSRVEADPEALGPVMEKRAAVGKQRTGLHPASGAAKEIVSAELKAPAETPAMAAEDRETLRPAEKSGTATHRGAAQAPNEPVVKEARSAPATSGGKKEHRAVKTAPREKEVLLAPEKQEVEKAPATNRTPSTVALKQGPSAKTEKNSKGPGTASQPNEEAPPERPPEVDPLERIEAFIASYCGAYEALNYERFMAYFALDALENDQTVKDLRPRYRTNFDQLQALRYRIEVERYTVRNDDTFEVSGDYVLRWRFKEDQDWEERRGPIFLALVPSDEDGFRVKRLVYR